MRDYNVDIFLQSISGGEGRGERGEGVLTPKTAKQKSTTAANGTVYTLSSVIITFSCRYRIQ